MIKRIKNIVVAALALSVALSAGILSACANGSEMSASHIHIDTDWNGVCDTCGQPVDEASIVPEKPEEPEPVEPEPGGPGQEEPGPWPEDPVVTPDKPVARVTVKTGPLKNEYFVGDEFVPEGGVLTVNYTDRTSEEISFTDKRVTFAGADTSTTGSKSVTVTYGGKRATFTINVIAVAGVVTFESNCAEVEDMLVKVGEGRMVERPVDPERPGYEFFDWYADEACTVAYRFGEEEIATDITLYAAWKGADDCVVTYDLNYYGVKVTEFSQIVASGEAARAIDEPERAEFAFEGWFTDEGLTAEYSAGAPITGDTVLRAKWRRTSPGTKTYTFEAENTDLTGKVGPGFSGESLGADMIVADVSGEGNQGASGGRFVSSLYKKGLGLEFYIASSEAVDNATVSVSVAYDSSLEKPGSLTFSCEEYQVIVNGTPMEFDDFTVVKGEKFSDKIVIEGVSLKEGANFIQLLTNNDRHPWGEPGQGTYQGSAPVIDCIKITTSSVLIWDENHGLPANVR
ncbi:MAG TPA: InlB B-repeat-containing protein [Candidatus Coproplasma stercoripullorum]|uniref:InlB B-repeat-containing protein n=1 Tax=Candidatus Coproplasma stercoripullorum TaxID=2840751 RepID=A0A9D1AG16_9FIRM|nr:InlB B-repeat-containing protein [Candidatus Coproplasma stercoripullorum]